MIAVAALTTTDTTDVQTAAKENPFLLMCAFGFDLVAAGFQAPSTSYSSLSHRKEGDQLGGWCLFIHGAGVLPLCSFGNIVMIESRLTLKKVEAAGLRNC